MSLAKWFPFKFNRHSERIQEPSSVTVHRSSGPVGDERPGVSPSPFGLMRDMMNDPFFTDPFGGFGKLDRWFGDHSPLQFQPSVDVVDRGKAIEITAELPGLDKDDVKIAVSDGSLTLSGEKRVESETNDENGCYRVERAYGSFRRVLPLPEEVNLEKVDARFKNGVLKITLPKTKEGAAARKIAIH